MTAPTSNLSITDLTHLILLDLTQPASAAEIKELVDRTFGQPIEISTLRLALDGLVARGMISYRTESREERVLRCGGGTPTSRPARLYAAGTGAVPARTVAELVPGVRLKSAEERRPRGKNKKRRTVAKRPAVIQEQRPASTGTVTDMINELVERLVTERTAGLVAENRELRNRLAALKSLIG